jgi:hypothetical protein
MSPDYDQLGRFVAKRTPSLDRIERLVAIGIMFNEQGDEQATRDMDLIVSLVMGMRAVQGLPSVPKWGGMDRKGVE